MTRSGLRNTGRTGIDRIVFSIPDYFLMKPSILVEQFWLLPRSHDLRNTITSMGHKFGHVIVALNLDRYRTAGETVPMSMLRLTDSLRRQFGETFDLTQAKIALVEIHRDAFTNNLYSDYKRILRSISLPGMRQRWSIGSTFYVGSKLFWLKIYDKGQETKDPEYRNLMRMEFTIKRRSHRLNTSQIRTVHDLLKNFHRFESILFSEIQTNLQRLTKRPIQKILPGKSLQSMIGELWLRNKIYADEATAWIVADSRGNLKWEEVEENIRAVYVGQKNTLYRKLARARGIFETVQFLRPTSRLINHSILCAELQEKFTPNAVRCYDLENPFDFEEVLRKTSYKPHYAA